MVPDKVAYTSGEKKAEILGGIMLAVFAAVIIALMALGVSGGGNIIMLVVFLKIWNLNLQSQLEFYLRMKCVLLVMHLACLMIWCIVSHSQDLDLVSLPWCNYT